MRQKTELERLWVAKTGRTTSYMKWFAVVILVALVSTGCDRAPSSIETSGIEQSVPSQVWVYSSQVQAGDTNKSHIGRPVYPFSLVPGGVYSATELSRALGVSKNLRAHYAEVDFKNLRLSRIKTETSAYVSYRRGNTIYWTKNRVRLRTGELVLTDGQHLVRARCANQISLVPQQPVEVQASPVVENQLDVPVEAAPLEYAALNNFDSEFRPSASSGTASSDSGAAAPMYVSWPSVAAPNLYAVCSGCSGGSNTNPTPSGPTTKRPNPPTMNHPVPPSTNPPGPPSNPPGGPTQPVPVPEPGSVALLVSAVAFMGPALLRAKRRQPN